MKVHKPTWQLVISFPVACSRHVLHLSYSSIIGATFERLKICPNPVQNNSRFSLLPEKENKKLKIVQSYIYVYMIILKFQGIFKYS